MEKSIQLAIESLVEAQSELKNAAKDGIDAGEIEESRRALNFERELDEKRQQLEEMYKRLNGPKPTKAP